MTLDELYQWAKRRNITHLPVYLPEGDVDDVTEAGNVNHRQATTDYLTDEQIPERIQLR